MTAGHPVRLMSTSGAVDLDAGAGAVEVGASDGDRLLAALADLQPGQSQAVSRLPARDLDVVAVVCGADADMAPLLLDAGRAAVGVVLVVDPAGRTETSTMGTALVLGAPGVEDLLSAWDTVVAR
ncbi:hypothetical protein GCM10029964_084220 [Kibdelosporangium lantanae]